MLTGACIPDGDSLTSGSIHMHVRYVACHDGSGIGKVPVALRTLHEQWGPSCQHGTQLWPPLLRQSPE